MVGQAPPGHKFPRAIWSGVNGGKPKFGAREGLTGGTLRWLLPDNFFSPPIIHQLVGDVPCFARRQEC